MLTLALSSWSFHRRLPYFPSDSQSSRQQGLELTIHDFPRLATSFGITDLEICQAHLASADHDYIAGVRSSVEAAGCRVINVPIDVGNLAETDSVRRRADTEQIRLWIDAAYELGSPCVRVNTGPVGTQHEESILAIVTDGYRHLADY